MSVRRIRRLLVANRGEIARRIFRTAHAMGIDTVAVYAEPDRDMPFVCEAGQAVALGGTISGETYLDVTKLLDAARRSGADAVHPGYGFLSENAGFARALIEAGLTWVGPHPEAISAMGDKLAAKRLFKEAGVPMLESVELAADAQEHHLQALAAAIGYPVLVKAAAGGGGRGMRVVREPGALKNAVASARREAKGAFGDDTVFLEKYLDQARHVEIQLFGDKHGNLLHLFERECSIQRRHQKIIEEAPSSAVSAELRGRMGQAAVAAGRLLGYDNAGTVEFLLDESGSFYFLEVNTRLQVEHPVTEAITGLDLVREQIRVAEGEPLSFRQGDLHISGHAIEARLYAEDPSKGFLPSPGRLLAFAPSAEPAVRWDAGVEGGSEVSVYFDPLLAKVIAHAPTRDEAALRLALALERLRAPGVTTNRDFLVNTLRHEAFLAGDTTTDFIERVAPRPTREPSVEQLRFAIVAAALTGHTQRAAGATVQRTIAAGWRNNPSQGQRFAAVVTPGGTEVDIEYRAERDGSFTVRFGDDGSATVRFGDGLHGAVPPGGSSAADVEIDGMRRRVTVLREGERWFSHDGEVELEVRELVRFPERQDGSASGGYEAPMPGKVIAVYAQAGDVVKEGQLLLVLEAMKMEHHVTCLKAGTIREVRVTAGEQVAGGTVLVVVE